LDARARTLVRLGPAGSLDGDVGGDSDPEHVLAGEGSGQGVGDGWLRSFGDAASIDAELDVRDAGGVRADDCETRRLDAGVVIDGHDRARRVRRGQRIATSESCQ
jgi:hypothetical protein